MWIDELVIDKAHEDLSCVYWVPQDNYVVLGNANQMEKECKLEVCEEDCVPILRRAGGGGAVVLHPGCLIVSVGAWLKHYYSNSKYFRLLNDAVITCLESAYSNIHSLRQEGISDIAHKKKKIAGTSLFRSRNFLIYQASILVEDKVDAIEKYLEHPSDEPDYREGKAHKDFLGTLQDLDKNCTPSFLRKIFERDFEDILREKLGEELVEAKEDQLKYLKNRFAKKPKTHVLSKQREFEYQ